MTSAYTIELRRSPLLTALPVLIAVDLVVLFGRSRYWIGVWPEASAAAQVVTLFLGPALAAVSAWQAGRSSRAGLPEFLLGAARPAWRIEAVRLAATLTLGLLAYGLGCLVAAAVSVCEAGPGFLWPSYVLLGAATLVVFAAVGHLAGRWWPSPAFTPVICALGCFVALLGLPVRFNVLSGHPDTRLGLFPLALRLLLALALAVLAVTAPPRLREADRDLPPREPPWRIRGVFLGSVLTVLLTLGAALPAGELGTPRPASAVTPLCARADGRAPEVCVWPEHRRYLPELTAMARRLDDATRTWNGTPDVYREAGLRPARLGDRGFWITEGHARTAAVAMAQQVFTDAVGRCAPPRKERRALQAVDSIHLWLEYRATGQDPAAADRGADDGTTPAGLAATRAARMDPAGQRAWVAAERGRIDEETWCVPDDPQ
ncbi:DUF7224 domain-containing protein [Streptomyces laurentii]|uniref:DUF7224 domain-containing protein n=1 Tax=Streptomyces laurentii TaxID=39478 RepID=UPI003681DFA6